MSSNLGCFVIIGVTVLSMLPVLHQLLKRVQSNDKPIHVGILNASFCTKAHLTMFTLYLTFDSIILYGTAQGMLISIEFSLQIGIISILS